MGFVAGLLAADRLNPAFLRQCTWSMCLQLTKQQQTKPAVSVHLISALVAVISAGVHVQPGGGAKNILKYTCLLNTSDAAHEILC
jgi:hypothetical protein